jgi:hypothetical protein
MLRRGAQELSQRGVRMTEKQMFKVLVRWLGVIILLDGIRGIAVDLMIWTTPAQYGSSPPLLGGQEQVYLAVFILLGLMMIRFPEWIVYITWWEELPSRDSHEQTVAR